MTCLKILSIFVLTVLCGVDQLARAVDEPVYDPPEAEEAPSEAEDYIDGTVPEVYEPDDEDDPVHNPTEEELTGQPDDGYQELEEVVVTGTRTEKKLLDTPVRTQVVTKEEIRRTHARDLKEALEYVPGLLLKETEKNGYSVWMQGFDADRVLILLNGRRVTASTGSTVDITQISAADIERIEIVKGPVSALYGSDSMAGVINVITSKPPEDYSATILADIGTFGDKNVNDKHIATEHLMANLTANRGPWSVALFSDVRFFEGYDLDKSDPNTNGDEGYRWNVSGQFAYTLQGGTEFYFYPRYYKEDKTITYTTFTPGLGDVIWERRENADTINFTLGSTVPFKDGSRLQGALNYERFHDISILDIPSSPQLEQKRDATFLYYSAETQYDRPIGEKHLATIGGIMGRQTLEQDQIKETVNGIEIIEEIAPGADMNSFEAYAQDDYFATPWLELLPGVRYQYDTDFGSNVSPKINVMISPLENLRLRLGYGRGYRVPNLKERYYFFDHSALGYIILGNPDLVPEKSDGFQVGAEGWWQDLRWDVNLFYNRIHDLIDVRLDEELSDEMGLQVFQYINVRRATTMGAELAATYNLLRYFIINAGYTYLWAKDTDLDKWLTGRPKHQVKAGVDILNVLPGNMINLRAVYQSSEYVDEDNTITSPGWAEFDGKINQDVWECCTVFLGVDNIFDVHRNPNDVNDLRPSVGRYIYLGIRSTFQISKTQH